MSENRVLDFLEKLGIRSYEGKAYLALLSLGEATASQISSRAKIPLARVYEVLNSLVDKGLAVVRAGRPRKYKAIHPRIALNFYIKNYVNKLVNVSREVIDELDKKYGSATEEGLSIWVSSNFDVSLERAKKLIEGCNNDGFLSASEEILDKMITSLKSKLILNPSMSFALVLTFDPYKYSRIEELLDVPNLKIKIAQSGILNALETDYKSSALFGDEYTLFTSEKELILVINESFYHGIWRISREFKNFNIKENITYKLSHHWLALELITEGLREGYKPKVSVEGVETRSREYIKVQGYVEDINIKDFVRNFTIKTEGNRRLVVGGIGASVEDIEAHYIEVIFL